MTERYLDDFAVGQIYGSGRLRVEGERIKTFAREFDPQPFHLDEEAARQTIFRGLAASGWHTAAPPFQRDQRAPVASGRATNEPRRSEVSKRLSGKATVVTGGSRGIGAAIARRLAADGANVAITYAGNKEAAEKVVGELKANGSQAFAIQANAGDPQEAAGAVRQVAERYGGIDILVHNAGVAGFAPLPESDFSDYRRQFAVNVDGVFAGTRAAADHIRDGGRIIVIGSVNAHTMPVAGGAIYSATKAAVAALVRGWARDLGPRNILVNVIQPGPIDTDINPADGEFAERIRPLTALGRYGRPEEIANLAAFLASDEASYITGAAIDIDGGMTI